MNAATRWAATRKRHKYAGIMHNKEVQAASWPSSKPLASCGFGFVPRLDRVGTTPPGRRLTDRQGALHARPQVPGTPSLPARLRPARRQGARQATQRAARGPGAPARASGGGRPGDGHGPLRVDQRPPGDQRDAGDPAARRAHLRRRGEGRGGLGDGRAVWPA